MSKFNEQSIRSIFAGQDPAEVIRRGASDFLKKAIANGERRDREARAHKYESNPELAVVISRVRDQPPLWCLRTHVAPVGKVEIYEESQASLIPELRHRITCALIRDNWCSPDEARKRAALMPVRVEHVLLRDSQRHEREWNR